MKIAVPFPKMKDFSLSDGYSAGLDIGTQAAKLVILKFTKDQIELCDFKISSDSAAGREELFSRIKHYKELQSVNLSVSGPSTIIRYVNFPRMSEQELKNALRFEAQKHIPFSIAEVNFDSYILKEDISANNIVVLLAAVKKDVLKERLSAAEKSGLRVGIMDMDSLALINAFNFNNAIVENKTQRQACALLNIGALTTNLNVLEDSTPHLSRDIHIAGNNLTQKIADICGLDLKAADKLKVNPDKARAQDIVKAIDSVSAALIAEVRGSFDYYESQSASNVSKIYLSGGSALLAGFKDALANLLGIEVDYWNPFKRMSVADGINKQELAASSSQLAVAVGLALRR